MIDEKFILDVGIKYKKKVNKKLQQKDVPGMERLHMLIIIDYSLEMIIRNGIDVINTYFPKDKFGEFFHTEKNYDAAIRSMLEDINRLRKINEGFAYTKLPGEAAPGFLRYWLRFWPNVDYPGILGFDGHEIRQKSELNKKGLEVVEGLEKRIEKYSL